MDGELIKQVSFIVGVASCVMLLDFMEVVWFRFLRFIVQIVLVGIWY